MATPLQNTQSLFEKIQSLPTERIAEVEDFVDLLRKRVKRRQATATNNKSLDFPVDDLDPWPDGLSLRKKDMYGNDGR